MSEVQKWEYDWIQGRLYWDNFIEELNEAGKQGWELVGVQGYKRRNKTMLAILKRPVEES